MERWKSNLYVLWVTQVLSLLSFGLFAPYIPIYLRELNITEPDMVNLWTGIMSFVPAAAMVIAAPVWGVLSDRYGKKMMLLRATACATAIITGMAFVTNVWQLLFLRACQGFFTGTVTASMAFVGSNTPENRMSYALGFLSSSGFIGYSIGPVVGGLFVDTLGIRPCFLIGGASMGTGFLLLIFLLKELSPPPPRVKGQKKNKKVRGAETAVQTVDAHLQTTGKAPQAISENLQVTENFAQMANENSKKTEEGLLESGIGSQEINEKSRKHKQSYRQLFTVTIILTLTMLLSTRMMRSMLGPYMNLFVEELLGTTESAATWTGVINGAVCIFSAIATLTVVRLGDRYNKIKLVILLTLISLPFATLSATVRSLILFLLIYSTYSFTSGALEPLLTSSASENADPQVRGTLFGLVGMVNNAGFMLAPILGSYVSVKFSIQGILYLIPAFTAIQIFIGLFAVKLGKKNQSMAE